jgi:hypothetical protein
VDCSNMSENICLSIMGVAVGLLGVIIALPKDPQ